MDGIGKVGLPYVDIALQGATGKCHSESVFGSFAGIPDIVQRDPGKFSAHRRAHAGSFRKLSGKSSSGLELRVEVRDGDLLQRIGKVQLVLVVLEARA